MHMLFNACVDAFACTSGSFYSLIYKAYFLQFDADSALLTYSALYKLL